MKTKYILTALLTMLFALSNANAADFTYEEDLYVGGSYEGKTINVTTSDILQAIGASSIDDVTMYAIKTDGTRTADYRHDGINADGWRTKDGTFTNWGNNSAFYVQPDHNTGAFVVGQFPGAITAPTRLTADFVYVNNSTSEEASVTIIINIIDPTFTVVKTIDLPICITAGVAYEPGNEVSFDLEDAKNTLGFANANEITAYIYQPDETYTANTTDGWRNAEGYAAGWASGASMVCCKPDIAGSKFYDIMAIDDSYAENSTYTAKWVLTANNKAIVYNINITFKAPVSATMSVTSAQYSTFCAPFEVTIPAGVTASLASLDTDGTTLTLQPLNQTIPANTPVILFSEEELASITFTGLPLEGNPTAGVLTGVYADTTAPDGSYVLQNQNGTVAFYKVASAITVPANKAYLTHSVSNAKVINFPSATAINAIESLTSGSAKIYDINGRELNSLQKGINIVNGVKVIVK